MFLNIPAIMTNLSMAIVGVLIGLIFMFVGYKIFDAVTPFDTARKLDEGNLAVGAVISSIFVGISIMIGIIIGSVLG